MIDRVRHIATSWSGSRVALAGCETRVGRWDTKSRVGVWNLKTGKQVSEFDSILDFGGRRLAITNDGKRIIAGAYHRHGVACYNATTGKMLWQRQEFKKLQHVSISSDDRLAYCTFQFDPARALDVKTGEEVGTLTGVGAVYPSPFDKLLFIERGVGELRCLSTGTLIVETALPTRILDAAFSPTRLLTSAMGIAAVAGLEGRPGCLRCFDIFNAAEVWGYTPEVGTHAVRVGYDEAHNVFLVGMRNYQRGGPMSLMRFDAETGEFVGSFGVPDESEHAFCLSGSRLLTADGTLLDTATGSPHAARAPRAH